MIEENACMPEREQVCIEMANLPVFWKTKEIAIIEYKKLKSNMAKLNAVKEQIRIHVIGFGWKDLHHPWLKEGHAYTIDELLRYLTEWLIPEQSHRGIPDSLMVDILSKMVIPQLSMRTADVAKLDQIRSKLQEWEAKGHQRGSCNARAFGRWWYYW